MQLLISPKAKKQLRRFSHQEINKITRKILSLHNQPFSGKQLTGKLQGYHSLRAWPYRIMYKINKEKYIIRIETIEHRQGAYK